MPEVHMGIPSVIEAALLPGLIGWGRTREMLLTGVLLFGARGARHGLRAEGGAGWRAGCRDRADWLDAICRATPEAIRARRRR